MDYHPYSDIWPLMDGADFEKLKADIVANGLHLPVLTYKGKVLDGRNRERACEAVKVPARYAEAPAKTDEEALALVVSLNEHRRHLSTAQRAFAGAKLANIIHGHNRHAKKVELSMDNSSPTVSSETLSRKRAAKMLGVSPGSIDRARVVLEHGTADDVAEVVSGKVGLQTKAVAVRAVRNPRTRPVKQRTSVSAVAVNRPVSGGLAMTREQVDPEFTGTPTEWIDKYGHVQVMTAEQYATMRFGDWASFFRTTAKYARGLPEMRDVDLNWLRKPVEYDIAKLTEGLEYWEPKIAAARAMLDVAVAAVKQKT